MSKRQCKQIMNLPVKSNIWTRKRDVGHSGAVRIPGDLEADFIPRGPENLTPTRENICTRCDITTQHVQVNLVSQSARRYPPFFLYIQASKVSDKLSELLIVMDSMDIEDEEEGEDKEVVSTDEDSGLDNSEENYMDIEIFA